MRHLPFFLTLPAAAISTAAIVASAHAEDFLTVQQAQQELFPDADFFLEAAITLNDQQLDEIKNIAGVRQRQNIQKAWRAESKGQLLGWFLVDDVIGKHDFITYGTAISVEGKVLGIEILSYRETHGGQVRLPQWRANFVGKTFQDKFKLGQDVPNISGATLSCRNVTDGVKRLLAIHKIVLSGKK
ncbi:MAG: FMN-binding protein [Gammaproteobacteria bacterium]|nr:MAG: FMN-binding protein [Gammaproteobacteria bacterium]